MKISPAIEAQLSRYDAARRQSILNEAKASAEAQGRAVTVLDIRLAGIPKKDRTPKAAEKPAAPAPLLSESTSVILDTLPQRLKPSEVAGYLGISEGTVMNFRDTSELAFINIATPGATRPAWRITKESLSAFELRRQTAKKK